MRRPPNPPLAPRRGLETFKKTEARLARLRFLSSTVHGAFSLFAKERMGGANGPAIIIAESPQCYWGFTIKFTSLFFTKMVLTTCIPAVAFCTFSTVRAASTTAASSLSVGMVTVPFSFPFT